MTIRDFFVTTFLATFFTVSIFASLSASSAQVMQSNSYRIQSDSLNFGGGLATSTAYSLESTLGEVATGDRTGTNFNLRGGYQQMVTTFISMSTPSAVTMSPSIPGVTGGTANGSTTVTVTTDSPSGYTLTIAALENPAMKKGIDVIEDYVPAGDPDYTFITGASDAHFGYSPSGIDVSSRFRDNGTDTCNTGSIDTVQACWDGLDTIPQTIVDRATANTPDGSTTTIFFRVGVGSSVVQPEGIYQATTTLTALSL